MMPFLMNISISGRWPWNVGPNTSTRKIKPKDRLLLLSKEPPELGEHGRIMKEDHLCDQTRNIIALRSHVDYSGCSF